MSITVLPLQLGKPRHDTPPFSFSVGFGQRPACMTSEGLLPPRRLSELSCPSASQERSSGSSAASGFVFRPAVPAPLSRTFLRRSSWPRSGCPSRPSPCPPTPFPRSPTCRKPPAKRPAGRCGQMLPRRLTGGAPAPPEVSGPALRSPRAGAQGLVGAGARASPAGGRWRREGGRARRRVAARGEIQAGRRTARGRRQESERRGAGRCGAARARAAPRRGRRTRPETSSRRPDPRRPLERGRETWLRASPRPRVLTRHNRRVARGARRNPGVGGGAEPPEELRVSLGAKEDASTKASGDPARCGGRREESLRGAPDALCSCAASLPSPPRVAGSGTAAQGPWAPWQRPPQWGAACDARRRPRPPAFPAARTDRPEGAGAAGLVDCGGALPPRGPVPTRSPRRRRAPGECAAGAGPWRRRYRLAGGAFVFLPRAPARSFI